MTSVVSESDDRNLILNAQVCYNKHRAHQTHTYNRNTLDAAIVGGRGEMAVFHLLKAVFGNASDMVVRMNTWEPEILQHYPDPFLGFPKHGDLQVISKMGLFVRIEVKTVRQETWDRGTQWRRCVPNATNDSQLDEYAAHKAVVVWCVASNKLCERQVRVMGWNTTDDLVKFGRDVLLSCPNRNIQNDWQMRKVGSLCNNIRSRLRR
jgi:hypothetical protein